MDIQVYQIYETLYYQGTSLKVFRAWVPTRSSQLDHNVAGMRCFSS